MAVALVDWGLKEGELSARAATADAELGDGEGTASPWWLEVANSQRGYDPHPPTVPLC